MENKILIWLIVMVLAVSILFNLGDLTGYATKAEADKGPVIFVKNPAALVKIGSKLQLNVKNMEATSQSFVILKEDKISYAGRTFTARSSDCKRDLKTKKYECDIEHPIPFSGFPNGNYYVQSKDRRGRLTGIPALFTISS